MHENGPAFPLDTFRLWAKGAPRATGEPYHPLICHLIDVGKVASRLWEDCIPTAAQRWFADQIGIDPKSAARWATFWAAAHDVGKATPAFQERAAFLHPTPHGTASTVILREHLATSPYRIDSDLADRLATVVGGHHGVFPGVREVMDAADKTKELGRGVWRAHRRWLLDETARLFGAHELPTPAGLTNAGALWLAGFISVADWIGSNQSFFSYAAALGQEPVDFSLDAYAERSRANAGHALTALGWEAWPRQTQPRTFDALFPFSPNDVQRKTIEIAEGLVRPALVIVEAPMGEGKTEAALYLADRGSAALGMRGHYVALPTQATSNQMFQRVRDFLERRYPDEAVNTQLLHGHASLASDFRALLADEGTFLNSLDIPEDHNRGFDGASPGVVAATWFTARKRGLLAPFGVGTVDQALLAVLQTRHFFVRLLGLAGKTVVLDEVHAYDTYMSVLLERLLGWLAALGCTVVLLSATLPKARRDRLLRAYGGDLAPDASSSSLEDSTYPSLTWRSGDAAGTVSLEVAPQSRKRLALRWMTADAAAAHALLGRQLAEALRDGGCAAVICNTVANAQRTYRMLQDWFAADELSLFHARFLYEDRAARERETLRQFGKPAEGVVRPRRAVLVATQVIEQSLDLDFDFMISELAPVDLVLQRSGRLHRHERDDRPAMVREPTLWLLGPEERDGLPVFTGGVTHVYDEHILLRSWLALRDGSAIAIPEDVSPLIEAVYDDRECPDDSPLALADRWQRTRETLQAEWLRHEGQARAVLVLPPGHAEDGFLTDWNRQLEEDDPSIHQQLQALTRLGEKTVTAICLTPEEMSRLKPRAGDAWKRAEPLLRRSVGLSDRRIVHALADMTPPSSWKSTALLRHCRLIELDENGEAPIGRYRLRIDPELGAVVVGAGGE